MGQDTTPVATSDAETGAATSERVVAILESACRVVVREGAHGLRMASVAREAGVSKALVHYYFSTRQELLRSAFTFTESRWREAVATELETLRTGRERVARVLLTSIDADPPFGDQRALWNEVWSSLRFDDELQPLVAESYRSWLAQIVDLVGEGLADSSIPASVDAVQAGPRLAAVGDGLDSMLYLGLIDRDEARELMLGSLDRELGADE
jgi:AcrR family transcriptional regulator